MTRFHAVLLMLVASLVSVVSYAQDDKALNVNITKTNESTSTSFIASPWVWVVGGAVFVLLLVALLRGGGRSRSDA